MARVGLWSRCRLVLVDACFCLEQWMASPFSSPTNRGGPILPFIIPSSISSPMPPPQSPFSCLPPAVDPALAATTPRRGSAERSIYYCRGRIRRESPSRSHNCDFARSPTPPSHALLGYADLPAVGTRGKIEGGRLGGEDRSQPRAGSVAAVSRRTLRPHPPLYPLDLRCTPWAWSAEN